MTVFVIFCLSIYVVAVTVAGLSSGFLDQGPVVQSILSLTSLLRGQLLTYDFITKYTGIFCEKMREASKKILVYFRY